MSQSGTTSAHSIRQDDSTGHTLVFHSKTVSRSEAKRNLPWILKLLRMRRLS